MLFVQTVLSCDFFSIFFDPTNIITRYGHGKKSSNVQSFDKGKKNSKTLRLVMLVEFTFALNLIVDEGASIFFFYFSQSFGDKLDFPSSFFEEGNEFFS